MSPVPFHNVLILVGHLEEKQTSYQPGKQQVVQRNLLALPVCDRWCVSVLLTHTG